MSALEVICVAASALALVLAAVVVVVVRSHRRQTAALQAAIDSLAADVRAAQQPPEPASQESVPHRDDPRRIVGDVVVTPDGRNVVVPTTSQVVDATLGRPLVRATVLAHGLRRALRPEHRDRITAMMRREFHRRRKVRLRAGRRAAKLAVVRDDGRIGGVQDTERGEVAS